MSIVGGMGVLDGRGPMSMGRTGKGLGWIKGGGAPLARRSDIEGLLEREPVQLVPVTFDGILSTPISSISSIERKDGMKSCKLNTDI